MEDTIIRSATADTVLGEDGIVRAYVFPNTREDRATAKENVAAFIKICGGKKRPLMIDMTGTLGASREARRIYSNEDLSKHICASAMVVPSPLSRVLGSFFLGLNKPRHPLRLFTSEEEAIEWLKQYKE